MSDKKNAFKYDKYIFETYLQATGIEEVYGYSSLSEDIDLPFHQVAFAEKRTGEMISLFTADKGKPFHESLAKRILDDSNCEVLGRTGVFCDTGEEGLIYYIPLYNENAIRFMPDIDASISNCSNVNTEGSVELRFCFDDGYTFSALHPFKTGGSFSLSVADIIEDAVDIFEDNEEFFDGFLPDCPNARYDSEGEMWVVTVSSRSNLTTELEFPVGNKENRSIMRGEFRRALTMCRLVQLNETIL